MTVSELIEKLKEFPKDFPVVDLGGEEIVGVYSRSTHNNDGKIEVVVI